VVEELSKNDEPLKQVRAQSVAVLFVDIVGFTAFADGRTPEEVVSTLRQFHALMEREVFRHNGTLDKYLGDGLMATFGTPFAGDADASNALRCAQAMMTAADRWSDERKAAHEAPIRVSFGLHYGPVVLGDIGLTCLEFAVIGSTVNAASRLEALTRALALELAPIRVNAVSPGVVRTNLWQSMTVEERERLFEDVGNSLPVGRVGEPHDVAQAYLFLMQEGFATGQTIVVDGGRVLV